MVDSVSMHRLEPFSFYSFLGVPLSVLAGIWVSFIYIYIYFTTFFSFWVFHAVTCKCRIL